jgi:hypothetical protein
MESREKAEELFDKYYFLLTYFSENSSIDSRRKYAKESALIAVDEILKITWVDKFLTVQEYWQQVKQEIKNL